MLSGEKAVAEEADAAVRGFGAAALEDDVGGEVAGFGAEAVAGPGAGAGVSEEGETGVHEEVALGMLAELGGHAADDADFVDDAGDVREKVADGDAGLAVTVEGPVGGLDGAVVVELGALNGNGHGLAGVFFEEGFGVEGIDVGDAAAHVAEDDGAGFGGDALGAVDESGLGFLLNEAVQGCQAEAGGGAGEEGSAGEVLGLRFAVFGTHEGGVGEAFMRGRIEGCGEEIQEATSRHANLERNL